MIRAVLLALTFALTSCAPQRTDPVQTMTWPDLLEQPRPAPTRRIEFSGGGVQNFAELWLPDAQGPHRTILMVHGGCWQKEIADRTIMNYLADDLRTRGYAVWNIEYRGIDEEGGGYPGTFQDVARAADALRDNAGAHNLDLSRVVAIGHSAGGHLALWLAARPNLPSDSVLRSAAPLPIHTVITQGGMSDLIASRNAEGAACGAEAVDRLTGAPTPTRADVYADTNPARLLPLGVRQWVVNTEHDRIAPPWLGRAYFEQVERAGDRVDFLVLPDAGHVELIAPSTPVWSRQAEIIESLFAN